MYLDIGARALLAVVFLAATVSKWRDLASFRRSITEIGAPWPGLTAVVVAGSEAAVVLLVAIPVTLVIGYGLAAILLSAFIVGIAAALRSKRAVKCRCFGAAGERLRWDHVARNALLLTAVVTGAGGHLVTSDAPASAPGVLLAATSGGVLAVFVIRWDDVAFALGSLRVVDRTRVRID